MAHPFGTDCIQFRKRIIRIDSLCPFSNTIAPTAARISKNSGRSGSAMNPSPAPGGVAAGANARSRSSLRISRARRAPHPARPTAASPEYETGEPKAHKIPKQKTHVPAWVCYLQKARASAGSFVIHEPDGFVRSSQIVLGQDFAHEIARKFDRFGQLLPLSNTHRKGR